MFLSSAIHQVMFASLSTLPFAVGVSWHLTSRHPFFRHPLQTVDATCPYFGAGQVQDVGLIFLSAIASSIVQQCGEAGWSADNTLATVLVACTTATFLVGILIVCTGERWPPLLELFSVCEPAAAACRCPQAGQPGAVRAAAGDWRM